MKQLIDYILSRDRRLVCPVGGGSVRRFGTRWDSLPESDRKARWMAFQAETYGHDFLSATLLDVHICRSFGLKTFFIEDGSEHTAKGQVTGREDLEKLDVARALNSPLTRTYIRCVSACKRLTRTPVGGACFGPFTTAGSILGTQNLCLACVENPGFLHGVLAVISDFILKMARACERAGADFFWIAEPSAVLVSPEHFRQFSGQYIKAVFQGIGRPGFLHVPGDTGHLIDEFLGTSAQCLSLDHHLDMRDLLHRLPSGVSVLGNINSLSMLLGTPSDVAGQAVRLNRSIRNFPNVIVGSGGGLAPDTPEENIKALFDVTRQFPFRTREAFRRIDSLWHAMALERADDILSLLRRERVPDDILLESFEEACCFTGRCYQKGKSDFAAYTGQMAKLKAVLDTVPFNSGSTLFLEGNALLLRELRDRFFDLVHAVYAPGTHAGKRL